MYFCTQRSQGSSMPKQIITSAQAPTTGFTPGQAVSPLAQAIRFGNMLFVSGQGSLDPTTGAVVAGDIVVQTRRTLDNLMIILEAAGATAKNIVNMRVILRDVADFPRFNETFRDYFAGEKVTRTCFGGTLHRAGIDVEIDCVAMFD
jgi:2-iminobutanoate/2-iminopropanoate deaminase